MLSFDLGAIEDVILAGEHPLVAIRDDEGASRGMAELRPLRVEMAGAGTDASS